MPSAAEASESVYMRERVKAPYIRIMVNPFADRGNLRHLNDAGSGETARNELSVSLEICIVCHLNIKFNQICLSDVSLSGSMFNMEDSTL